MFVYCLSGTFDIVVSGKHSELFRLGAAFWYISFEVSSMVDKAAGSGCRTMKSSGLIVLK